MILAFPTVGNAFLTVGNDLTTTLIPDRQECIPDRRECRRECHLEWKAMVGIKVTSSIDNGNGNANINGNLKNNVNDVFAVSNFSGLSDFFLQCKEEKQ